MQLIVMSITILGSGIIYGFGELCEVIRLVFLLEILVTMVGFVGALLICMIISYFVGVIKRC